MDQDFAEGGDSNGLVQQIVAASVQRRRGNEAMKGHYAGAGETSVVAAHRIPLVVVACDQSLVGKYEVELRPSAVVEGVYGFGCRAQVRQTDGFATPEL